MIHLLFIFTSIFFSTPSIASTTECPNLSGTYDCKQDDPEYGSLYMRVSQKKLNQNALQYIYEYRMKKDNSLVTLKLKASNHGIYNEKIKNFGICDHGGYYNTKTLGDLSQSARNEIDANGNYLNIQVSNQKVYRCDRIF